MKVSREKLRGVAKITLECESEDRTYRGEFEREDGSADEDLEKWIEDELSRGNQWAWCVAHVTASFAGMEGEDWLGGCSYKSKKDFIETSCYYNDMISDAVEALAKRIETIVDGPDIWVHTNPACLVCMADAPVL